MSRPVLSSRVRSSHVLSGLVLSVDPLCRVDQRLAMAFDLLIRETTGQAGDIA